MARDVSGTWIPRGDTVSVLKVRAASVNTICVRVISWQKARRRFLSRNVPSCAHLVASRINTAARHCKQRE